MKKENSVYVTAEAGINHNGNMDNAREMIRVADNAGTNCVKFQYLIADEIAQEGSKYYDVFKRAELEHEELLKLKNYAEDEVGIDFKITATSPRTAQRVKKLEVDRIKIGSANLTNTPLLNIIAEDKRDYQVFLSSGMATIGEIEKALSDLNYREGDGNFYLYHCVSNYPADHENLNLRSIKTLQSHFTDIEIGFSDHTTDSVAAVSSVTLGATLIEKHFTLSHDMDGPDHGFSADPEELNNYVDAIRKTSRTLGSSKKQPAESEVEHIAQVRRFFVTTKKIQEGESLDLDNLTTKRVNEPDRAIEASDYETIQDFSAPRSYEADEVLRWSDFK